MADMTTEQLVERFAAIGIQQDDALLGSESSRFNTLFREMFAIEKELKARSSDQRHLLLLLFEHENAQVQLNAAKATLAVAPTAARQMLETLASSRRFPQAGDAGMSLWNLDRGVFKPT
jgi:hypothetical protein